MLPSFLRAAGFFGLHRARSVAGFDEGAGEGLNIRFGFGQGLVEAGGKFDRRLRQAPGQSALAADRALLIRLSLNALQRYRQQPKWEQTAGEIRRFLVEMIKKSGK